MQDAAIGIVEDPQNKNQFLFVKRRDVPVWVLPGGGIDTGETPEEAVEREVFEESGLEVNIIRKAAVYSPVSRWTATTHIFICAVKRGAFKKSQESAEIGYFPVSELPALCFPLHAIWLKEALESKHLVERPLSEFTWGKVGAFLLKHPYIFFRYLVTLCSSARP